MQLEEALARTPDEPETLSQLATCLLRLGEFAEAVAHFERAALLAPDRAIHHWNLGGAARACGRMSLSYSALVRYLEIADDAEGWRARRREARRFMRSYEKLIRTSYPGTAALDLQRGEELFLRAYDDMTSGRYEEASDGFRGVIALLPAHYPSWGNLGAALVALGDGEGATRCLLRALELRPDYQIARDNLALLD